MNDRLNAIGFSVDPGERYTRWTGLIGCVLALVIAAALQKSFCSTPRGNQTILIEAKTGDEPRLNFEFANKIQKKFPPLYAKAIVPGRQETIARQLPIFYRRIIGGRREADPGWTPERRAE